MRVLLLYLVLVAVGQVISVLIGLAIDPFSKTASLAVFIPTYYAMYWIAWRITLMIADRSSAPEEDSAGDSGTPAKTAMWLLAPVGVVAELVD
jgi:hypothetical protein